MKKEELYVTLPYKRLAELISAAERVEALEQKMNRLLAQNDALRCQFVELMDRLRELV